MSCDVAKLIDQARLLRRDVVNTVYLAKDGHPSPACRAPILWRRCFLKS